MDVRNPDSYKTETLVEETMVEPYSSEDTPFDELEKAKLESLEETWKYNAACNQRWQSFQSILTRVKRLGMLDASMKQVYDLLSASLYKYSYHQDVSITEEEFILIDKQLQHFRMSKLEKDTLNDSLLKIRYEHSMEV
jgi:hypothetical protein